MNHLLHPEHLRSVAGLELLARHTVDSILPGLNRSRRTGPGTAFSQYRSYQPGDDLRRLDWKLFARSDRFFIRESEVETHTTIRFLLDASNSMRHADHNGLTKLDYARYLIATLAWLASGQGDALALVAFNQQRYVPLTPRQGQSFFRRFLYELLKVEAGGGFASNPGVETLLPGTRGRELLLFLTDLHEQESEIMDTLHRLSRSGHEAVLFHLLAGNELDLSFDGATVFEDLESGRQIQVDPPRIREAYLSRLQEHLRTTERRLLEWGVAYYRFRCDEPAGEGLRSFLLRRR